MTGIGRHDRLRQACLEQDQDVKLICRIEKRKYFVRDEGRSSGEADNMLDRRVLSRQSYIRM